MSRRRGPAFTPAGRRPQHRVVRHKQLAVVSHEKLMSLPGFQMQLKDGTIVTAPGVPPELRTDSRGRGR